MMDSRFKRYALLGVLAAGGCDALTNTCTLIGCLSGLEVRIDPPATPYRIEVYASPVGPRYVATCDSTHPCGPAKFFQDFTPNRVFVEVITATDTTRYEVSPQYKESRPNGDDCGPTCRNATVNLPADGRRF